MRREAWMGQHPDRVEARRRQKARMGAVKSGVVLPDRRHPQLLDLRFLHSLRLGATILKPDLHLSLGEVKGGREFGPLRDTQVLPFRELLLEREQLLRGERRPRLPVRLVFPQVALDLGRLPVLVTPIENERVPAPRMVSQPVHEKEEYFFKIFYPYPDASYCCRLFLHFYLQKIV